MNKSDINIILNNIIVKHNIHNFDVSDIINKVESKLPNIITENELYELIGETCINMSTINPIYSLLGGNVLIYNLHNKLLNNFTDKIKFINSTTNIINKNWLEYILDNSNCINNIINYENDYKYDYFAYKTLEKSYLLKINNIIIESPQDMILRTAIVVQMGNIELIKKTYEYMSEGYYTHATPTLFNSGLKNMQLSSCYLLGVNDNLIDICKSITSCAQISKWSGGIGIHLSGIRGKNSIIKGTNGISNGLVPLIKIYNDIARWIDQGGKRPGSVAIYLEPHHPDIFEFLEVRKTYGAETERARDIFLGLWVSDLFMNKVKNDDFWYLLSSDECPNLNNVYGEEYEKLYYKYVNENKYRKKIKAKNLWLAILDSQIETGMPYISYKDTINKNNNQKNLGTIKSSNLCNEIMQYSDNDEYAVCNLASIGLKKFVIPFDNTNNIWLVYTKENCKFCSYAKQYLNNTNIIYTEYLETEENSNYLKSKLSNFTYPQIFIKNNNLLQHIGDWNNLYNYIKGTFDYDKLYEVAYLATINLNNIIDINYYPVEEAKRSNLSHRPIGLGIQGLADTISLLKISFESNETELLNAKIMETIYLASMTASNDIAYERHYKMIALLKYFEINNITLPTSEFYNKDYDINNKLYHELKPLFKELINPTRLGCYSSFCGSLFSEGKFQFDMYPNIKLNYFDKWTLLKEKVIKYGTRNSLLTALMPTASTSQIMGNTECFEYFTNNIYTRKTQAGDFIVVNKYLIEDLIKINLWTSKLKNKIIANNGSIQSLNDIPDVYKNIYKIIWEIKQLWVLKHAVARAPFVDQSQSMNIFMAEPDYQRLTSAHFWSWTNQLKTGMYYLRSKPAINPTKFTIDPIMEKNINTDSENPCINCSA